MMDVDGVFVCYSLEPRMDRSNGKPYAIPAATYNVTLQESPHFDALLRKSPKLHKMLGAMFGGGRIITPHIEDVAGFDDIEIHWGCFPKDTEGCCLVGETRDPNNVDFVGNSVEAFIKLMNKLVSAGTLRTPEEKMAYYELNEPLTITYKDAFMVTDFDLGM